MSVRPVTAYVQPHGLVFTDHAYDALTDELATEDPEHRERGLFESPSKYLARTYKRRADQSSGAVTRPASPPPAGCPDHDAPGGELSPPLGAVASTPQESRPA